PAPRSAFALQRLRDAGAIVHARTTTAELCCMPMSHARRWGATRNPWDLTRAVGGSSGGSAAALAAGTATVATGTDVGGSIRAPACLAGVVGYKPPHGRVPLEPPRNAESWLHAGPLARSVADAALLANAMAGPHPGDQLSLPAVPPLPLEPAAAAGMRVAFCARPGDLPVAAAVAANAERVATALAGAGVEVEPVELDWRLEELNEAMWGHGDTSRARAALDRERHRPGQLSPYAVECFGRTLTAAAAVPPERRADLERRLTASLTEALSRFDALIPTMGVAAMDAGEDYAARPLLVDDRRLDHFCDAALTPIFNIANACPVLAVPSGLAAVPDPGPTATGGPSPGVPTGVQVAAAPHQDAVAFRVAAAIERTAPWPRLAP
ncbi:MAG TPA: amidase, partial [Solirubrobacterales bacterium]|nr:amidase [Solirubrobacterales bacterium]